LASPPYPDDDGDEHPPGPIYPDPHKEDEID
jgi:hypothetical protein